MARPSRQNLNIKSDCIEDDVGDEEGEEGEVVKKKRVCCSILANMGNLSGLLK